MQYTDASRVKKIIQIKRNSAQCMCTRRPIVCIRL